MMQTMQAPPSLAVGEPMSSAKAQAGLAEIDRMRAALKGWLKYRAMNDRAAAGEPAPPALLRRPGTFASPAAVVAARLRRERLAEEGKMAADLYALLSEVFDSASLPSPDVAKDPNAAVKLAMIAIDGKLPGEDASPGATGFIWLWPLVIVVGAVVFLISSKIRNDAETAQERERLQCIREGRCTDYGFWLKFGAIGVVGFLAWDKFGDRFGGKKSR